MTGASRNGGLAVVDGLTLPERLRALLRPGEPVTDRLGQTERLPRFFYAVESWQQAKETALTPNFVLAELLTVDCREAPELLYEFPHFVPCAVTTLARILQQFRDQVKAPVYIAANGGYRSPAHRLSPPYGPHNFATAANIYRIGSTFLDNEGAIEHYRRVAQQIGLEVNTLPHGLTPGCTDDHLHLDIGYIHVVPRGPAAAL